MRIVALADTTVSLLENCINCVYVSEDEIVLFLTP